MRIDYIASNPTKTGSKEQIALELVTKTGARVHLEWSRGDNEDWTNPICTVRGGLDRAGFIDGAKIAAWLSRFASKRKFDINDPDALIVNLERRGAEQLVVVGGSMLPVKEVQGEVQRYRVVGVTDVDGNDVIVRASSVADAADTASKLLLNLQNEGKVDLDSFVGFLKNKQVEKIASEGVKIPDVVNYCKRGGKRAVAAAEPKAKKEEPAAEAKKVVLKKK